VRYRSAAILSAVLIGGMVGLPAAVWAIFLSSLKQGLPIPIPGYERILLGIAVVCGSWSWILVLPIASMLFTIAAFTHARTPAKPLGQQKRTPPSKSLCGNPIAPERVEDAHCVGRGKQGIDKPWRGKSNYGNSLRKDG
jgi:hypothetical protein